MTRSEQAQALRDSKEPHYNCCQSVLIPFCEVCGISEEAALRMGENFGSGMRHGGTCGAISGALMALGLAGKGAPETKQAGLRRYGGLGRGRGGAAAGLAQPSLICTGSTWTGARKSRP